MHGDAIIAFKRDLSGHSLMQVEHIGCRTLYLGPFYRP